MRLYQCIYDLDIPPATTPFLFKGGNQSRVPLCVPVVVLPSDTSAPRLVRDRHGADWFMIPARKKIPAKLQTRTMTSSSPDARVDPLVKICRAMSQVPPAVVASVDLREQYRQDHMCECLRKMLPEDANSESLSKLMPECVATALDATETTPPSS